ncbi:MAG: diacylglycerol/polyprenol kinase family protein [Spirochaetia bacterium]
MSHKLIISELTRKLLHISGFLCIPLAHYSRYLTILLLSFAIIVYMILEILRLAYQRDRLFHRIVIFASRGHEFQGIVLGPITLALGIIIVLAIFPLFFAQVGIVGLTLGDGFSSLIGRFWGKRRPKILAGKSIEGCLACFFATLSGLLVLGISLPQAFLCAFVVMLVEVLPFKNFDNIIIPIVASSLMFFISHVSSTTILFS